MAREPIKPKEVTLKDMDGGEHRFMLSRLPYPVGRKVAAVYPVANAPKIGNYAQSQDVMLDMFQFISVIRRNDAGDDVMIPLSNLDMISNHVPDSTVGLRLEAAMLAYNFDFFGQGGLSEFLKKLCRERLPSIIQMLTQLLPPSLVQEFAAGLKSKQDATSKTS